MKHLQTYWYYYAIGIVVILIVLKISKDKGTPKNGINKNSVSFTTDIDKNIVLRKGSQGSEVRELQIILNQMLTDSGNTGRLQEDGIFGNLTLTALMNMAGVSETTLNEMNR